MAGWADSSPQRGPVLPAVRHAHVRLVSKDLHLLVEVDLQVVSLCGRFFRLGIRHWDDDPSGWSGMSPW